MLLSLGILAEAEAEDPPAQEPEQSTIQWSRITANAELPPQVAPALHGLTLFADYSNTEMDQIQLYLVNRSGRTVPLNNLGNCMEVETVPGQWVRAQVSMNSDCGTAGSPLYLGDGQSLSISGYRPAKGREARVRYVLTNEPFLVSNTGTGRVLDSDVVAAAKDDMSVRGVPSTLREVLDITEKRPFLNDGSQGPGTLPGEEYAAALQLLWSLHDSPRYRQRAGSQLPRLWKDSYGDGPRVAASIRATLAKRGPEARDPAGFLTRCLEALRFPPNHNAAYGSPEKYPELIWKALADLARRPETSGETGRLQPQWKEVMELLASRIDAAAGEQPPGAATLFSCGGLVDEFISDAKLLEWLLKTKTGFTRMEYGQALVRRNQHGKLAKAGLSMSWADRRWVLMAMMQGPGESLPDASYEIPRMDDEFILSCLELNPISAGAILQNKGQAEGTLRHKLLSQHLGGKALEWVSAKEPTDLGGEQAAELIGAIRYLAEFDRESDERIFRNLLRSTCYQMGTSIDSSGKEIKLRQFFLRNVAKTILLERGLSIPEKLKLEIPVP